MARFNWSKSIRADADWPPDINRVASELHNPNPTMSAALTAVPGDSGPDRQVTQLRIPPHSIEAESSVLGGLLLDNACWDRVGDLLVDGDFYRYEHRLVFAAAGALINANKPADVITVFEHLKSLGNAEDVGGLTYCQSK